MSDVQESEQAAPAEAGECLPCRGTGSVVSFLGGERSSVPCPWCSGTGVRQTGIDAQARWVAQAGEAADGAGASDAAAPDA